MHNLWDWKLEIKISSAIRTFNIHSEQTNKKFVLLLPSMQMLAV